ncbi:MAG: P-loop NTPase, partial [Halobacteria archaeon]|nr:P-loop NTPase [Halobacteria archaeon]
MTVDRDEVIDALRNVEDPELEEDIVTLEMVESVEVDGSTVLIGIDLPSERMKDKLNQDIRSELSSVEGVSELKIDWGDDEEEHESEMLPDVDNIIAVSSGKGGVGKSTFSVNLAVALAQEGYDVGLFDADVYGPNVPRMIGKSAQPRVSKDEMIIPPKKYGMKIMSMGFLAGESTPVVWRGALVHNALTQLLGDV